MSINILVPEVGESIVDARVARWLKKEGDAVAAGEPLVELETDKVDVEVAAPKNGVLESIAHKDGADVKIGDVLGTIDVRAAPSPSATSDQAKASAAPETPEPPRAAAAAPSAATPSARKLAREKDVELADVKPEGPRVTKADVERSVARPAPRDAEADTAARPPAAAPAAQTTAAPRPPTAAPRSTPAPSPQTAAAPRPAAPARPAPPRTLADDRPEERVRMSKRRATIARRLVEVQQTAAMLTTFQEVDMSAVMALRERHKEGFKAKHGVSLGIASFFVKAAIAALREFPRLNAEIQGDEMVLKGYYDIGIAVGASEVLVVPVLRDADRLSFAEIELGIRDFAKRANDGTLTLDDLRGGTFSITNGGVYGSLMSTPILNPPQVGILGLHAIKERPVGVGGQLVLRPMMYTALTYDHRIVDGAEAVRFLVRVRDLVEDPGTLLIES